MTQIEFHAILKEMTMNDQVRYQLERAEDALRQALKLGAEKEDPYLLRNITETIDTIKNWRGSRRFNTYEPKVTQNSYTYVGSGVRGGMSEDLINLS